MGLDIFLRVPGFETLFATYYAEEYDHFKLHSLSRTFFVFMNRDKHESGEEPEPNILGRITSTDITPLYDMETYSEDNDEYTLYRLEYAETEDEKKQILAEAKQSREKLSGNLDKVLSLINTIIEKLSRTDNLTQLFKNEGVDMSRYNDYFTDFNIDKGEGYIGNNLGQDLRNFRRFLEYAKEKGATTVFFQYG